jgi:hypothetical protein
MQISKVKYKIEQKSSENFTSEPLKRGIGLMLKAEKARFFKDFKG